MPTIQDALKGALAQAQNQETKALLKPLLEQVWLYVRDHPGVLAPHLASIFKRETHQAVNSLKVRGMVVYTRTRSHKGNNSRPCNSLTVNQQMRGVYELWPLPKKEKPAKIPVKPPITLEISEQIQQEDPQASKPEPMEEPATQEPKTPQVSRPIDIENLTINEARSLYRKLHVLFGPQHG